MKETKKLNDNQQKVSFRLKPKILLTFEVFVLALALAVYNKKFDRQGIEQNAREGNMASRIEI